MKYRTELVDFIQARLKTTRKIAEALVSTLETDSTVSKAAMKYLLEFAEKKNIPLEDLLSAEPEDRGASQQELQQLKDYMKAVGYTKETIKDYMKHLRKPNPPSHCTALLRRAKFALHHNLVDTLRILVDHFTKQGYSKLQALRIIDRAIDKLSSPESDPTTYAITVLKTAMKNS